MESSGINRGAYNPARGPKAASVVAWESLDHLARRVPVVVRGSVRLNGRELTRLPTQAMRALRGSSASKNARLPGLGSFASRVASSTSRRPPANAS